MIQIYPVENYESKILWEWLILFIQLTKLIGQISASMLAMGVFPSAIGSAPIQGYTVALSMLSKDGLMFGVPLVNGI